MSAATKGERLPKPPLPLSGGCSCGEVRYRIDAFPYLLYACHCTQCQRQSGSAFALNMSVPTASLHITHGTPKSWRRPTSTGDAIATSWFCETCGNRIYAERDTRPESVNVRAGTLDDTRWLVPAAHFFMENAQPWEAFGADAVCFDTAPREYIGLVKAWQALWTP